MCYSGTCCCTCMLDHEAWESGPFAPVELDGGLISSSDGDDDGSSTISGLSDDPEVSSLSSEDTIYDAKHMEWIPSPTLLSSENAYPANHSEAKYLNTHNAPTVVTSQPWTQFPRCDDPGLPCSSVQFVPLNDLPDELIIQVGSFLNVRALKNARSLNRRFRNLLSRNEAGWARHCRSLWQNKIHVSPRARELVDAPAPLLASSCWHEQEQLFPSPQPATPSSMEVSLSSLDEESSQPSASCCAALEAYRLSCADATSRQEITRQELCYDPDHPTASTVFSFRFKESAGPEWTSFDPWHEGREARQMVFLANGTVRQLVPPAAQSNTTSTRPHNRQQRPQLRLPFYDASHTEGLEIQWKFVRKPIDLPDRPAGAYLRLNVGGRDVPTYVVSRSPNGNWGFLLENLWGVFASFPLPQKKRAEQPQTTVEGNAAQAQPLTRQLRRRNRAQLVPQEQPAAQQEGQPLLPQDDDDHNERRRKRPRTALDDADVLADDFLTVTNHCQWREALLYNLGAATLPDGDRAARSLEQAWDDV